MKVDLTLIGYITTFENITKTNVKDCFINKNCQVVFVVKEGQGSRAVGKKAVILRKLERLFNKRIRIVEFNPNPEEFAKNFIYPLKSPEIKLIENELIIKTNSVQLKGLLLGRNKANFQELQKVIKKYFNIEVKID